MDRMSDRWIICECNLGDADGRRVRDVNTALCALTVVECDASITHSEGGKRIDNGACAGAFGECDII